MLAQAIAESPGPAKLKSGNPSEISVQLIQRLEFLHQRRSRLRPDSRHAGNVVNAVARQRQVVGKALGSHSVVALDITIAKLLARAVIPEKIAVTHQLRQVLVPGDERRAHSLVPHQAGE